MNEDEKFEYFKLKTDRHFKKSKKAIDKMTIEELREYIEANKKLMKYVIDEIRKIKEKEVKK